MKQNKAVNILSSDHKANLYPFYARLRAEEPVYSTTLPNGRRAWLITRYDDVVMVLKDERFAKDKSKALKPFWIPGVFKELAGNMLSHDGSEHARLRVLVQKVFSPGLVEQMRPRILSHAVLPGISGMFGPRKCFVRTRRQVASGRWRRKWLASLVRRDTWSTAL